MRAAIALTLPFVTEIWQVYVLIFLLQSASAAFTPTFQATMPDILPDEETYTKALSLSRLAYDMESLTSPMIAAALLTVISFNGLFAGTSVGFVASALLVVTSGLAVQRATGPQKGSVFERTIRGIRIYLATPRLVGLLAITLSAAAAGATVIVNTVVIVREELGLSQTAYAIALGAYGLGSMLVALSISSILKRLSDRSALLLASIALTLLLSVLAALSVTMGFRWQVLLIGWFLLGAAYSLSVTPSGRLLRRSSHSDNRPAVFAAQFSLSHACWLIAYPLAGWIGAEWGQGAALTGMCLLSATGSLLVLALWPANDAERVEHTHEDLPSNHPHLREGHQKGQPVHPFIIDELHTHWPKDS